MPVRRTMLRLLVALMTTLSTLQLTLEGSGVVCSSGRVEDVHRAMAPGAGPHGGHGASATTTREHTDAGRHQSDQRSPAQERCCESMSSCGMTTVAPEVERLMAPAPRTRLPAHSDAMLASVRPAPEPPPPKA